MKNKGNLLNKLKNISQIFFNLAILIRSKKIVSIIAQKNFLFFWALINGLIFLNIFYFYKFKFSLKITMPLAN
jgi:hypothetical protein